MRLDNKGFFVKLLVFFSSMGFGVCGCLLVKVTYIEPFFISGVGKFLADPFFITSFIFGASAGMLIFAPINVVYRLFRKRSIVEKAMWVFIGCFGIAGFFANIAVYQYVIKPKEMIICPREFGYKKNLMRFYVTDLSLCKSD